jgi:hypothetical protein
MKRFFYEPELGVGIDPVMPWTFNVDHVHLKFWIRRDSNPQS